MRSSVPIERRQRTAIGDVDLDASGVERDAARADDEHVGFELQRADDDLRRAHQLSDADHRRIGERGRGRNLQLLERLHPFLTRDGVGAERVEVVGQQDRRRLADPEDLRVALDVLERHHQDSCSRLVHRHLGRCGPARASQCEHDQKPSLHDTSEAPTGWPLASATFRTQVGSPVPRHATTSVRAPISKSASSRVNAAA